MGIYVWLDAILTENYIQTLLELRSTINLIKLNVGIIVFNEGKVSGGMRVFFKSLSLMKV